MACSQFTDARLIGIFERADQVDDTRYRDAASGIVKGELAASGDRALELHEFFEVLCMIALARANPRYGTLGNTKTTDAGSIVDEPMPGCLDKLLKNSVLKKAKSDGLTKVLKIVMKDPEVEAGFLLRAGWGQEEAAEADYVERLHWELDRIAEEERQAGRRLRCRL